MYIYIRTYVFIYTCTSTYICTYRYTCIYACVCTTFTRVWAIEHALLFASVSIAKNLQRHLISCYVACTFAKTNPRRFHHISFLWKELISISF